MKSEKQANSAFTKNENGQILTSIEWFKTYYKDFEFIPIVVMPKNIVTRNAKHNSNLRIITADKLESMKSAGKELIIKISNHSFDLKDESKCSHEIENYHLNFTGIKEWYTEAPNVQT